jgi:hypothetical protein
MSLIENFREYNGLPANKPTDNQIETAMAYAESELRYWIGDTVYNEAMQVFSTGTPGLKEKVFKGAENKLVWYFLLPDINVYVSDFGVVLATEGDKEFGGSKIRVANPQEIIKMKTTFFQDAWKGVSKYVTKTVLKPYSV